MSPPVPLTVTLPDRASTTRVLAFVSEIHEHEREIDRKRHDVREGVRYGASTMDEDLREWLRMVSVEARREARTIAEIRSGRRTSIVSAPAVRARIGARPPGVARTIASAAAAGHPPPYDSDGSVHWMEFRVARALLDLIDPWLTALEPLLLEGGHLRA
jgi:hypothetical protein